jgi:hypothetical protein
MFQKRSRDLPQILAAIRFKCEKSWRSQEDQCEFWTPQTSINFLLVCIKQELHQQRFGGGDNHALRLVNLSNHMRVET